MIVLLISVSLARAELPIDEEPIRYRNTTATDRIAKLQKQVQSGEVRLKHSGDERGYLASVLQALKIPVESQTLVFSKTSFQHTRIAPKTPRALYFNDDVYVGFVRGGDVLEFAAVDPQLGAVFYIMDNQPDEKPEFQRQTDTCTQCHVSGKTKDVPGLMLRSVFPDRAGYPVFSAGAYLTDQTSPFKERWGGWYVTGTHGDQRHMGNMIVSSALNRPESADLEAGANRTSLKGLVDTAPFLTSTSDIVALMVMEHQSQMHNLITSANYQARIGRHYDLGMNKAFNEPLDRVSQSTRSRINSAAEKLVAYMLFSEETKLTAPVVGSPEFVRAFSQNARRDAQGRSLRDFDLKTRLFKYPCSYLIDSEAFEGLPPLVKERMYERLKEILTGQDKHAEYAHLSSDDRRAILEILVATKPNLPADWKSLVKSETSR